MRPQRLPGTEEKVGFSLEGFEEIVLAHEHGVPLHLARVTADNPEAPPDWLTAWIGPVDAEIEILEILLDGLTVEYQDMGRIDVTIRTLTTPICDFPVFPKPQRFLTQCPLWWTEQSPVIKRWATEEMRRAQNTIRQLRAPAPGFGR